MLGRVQHPIEPCEQEDARAEGHQQEKKRGWVFRAVDEGKTGEEEGPLIRPKMRVAVNVDCANGHKSRAQTESEP